MSFLSNIFGGKRRKKLEALATELGFEYTRKDEFKMVKRLGAFQLFKKGTFRQITNLMSKDIELLESKIAIFDYQYTIQQGKTSATFVQTVFFMDSKKLGLPQFLIKPEHFFHRIGKYLGWVQDIEFEAHPEFSEKYLIQSEFPDMLKEMIPEELMHFFSIERKWSLEGVNYFLIFYRERKRLPPETIKEFYLKGLDIVRMLQGDQQLN